MPMPCTCTFAARLIGALWAVGQASIEDASTVLLGGSLLDRPAMDDRSLPASEVLAALTE